MVTGLRLMALIVDLALALGGGHLIFMGLGWVVSRAGAAGVVFVPLIIAAFLLWPVLFMGVPTGLWGRTPGKWVLGLRVVHIRSHPPSVRRALAREMLKTLALASVLGAVFCLIQILCTGTVWYDQLCGTTVEHSPWHRLTKTQRDFRKAMRDFRSGR